MKELTLQEVLQIAGGLPDQAALDELNYRASDTCAAQTVETPAQASPLMTNN